MVTQEKLKELFSYNAKTGHLTWKVSPNNSVKVGDRAGGKNKLTNYRQLWVDRKNYKEHRLIWLLVNGSFPVDCIDHINGIKDDNRISNLREANHSQNNINQCIQSNNTSGFKGVSYSKTRNKYEAYISTNRKRKHLGYFTTKEEAHTAYCEASLKYHKEFSRTN